MSHGEQGWIVVVPVKRARVAKSRLLQVTAQQRRTLARAFPADCAAAALATPEVAAVVMVTDDVPAARTFRALGAEVIGDEPDAGLNPALVHARAHVLRRHGERSVAVLSGDLPALRSTELSTALARASRCSRAFLADRAGEGTTLLTARQGTELDPRFGTASRQQHLASGAQEIDAQDLAGLRRDVDTWSDLEDAVRLGVGRHTAAALARTRLAALLPG